MVVAGTVLLIVTGAAFAWTVARANWRSALKPPSERRDPVSDETQ
jgi:hypothetical protein